MFVPTPVTLGALEKNWVYGTVGSNDFPRP